MAPITTPAVEAARAKQIPKLYQVTGNLVSIAGEGYEKWLVLKFDDGRYAAFISQAGYEGADGWINFSAEPLDVWQLETAGLITKADRETITNLETEERKRAGVERERAEYQRLKAKYG